MESRQTIICRAEVDENKSSSLGMRDDLSRHKINTTLVSDIAVFSVLFYSYGTTQPAPWERQTAHFSHRVERDEPVTCIQACVST
jgi:hypothetical protein